MKNTPLLFVSFTIILSLFLPVSGFAAESTKAQEIKVYVNDTKVEFDVPPIFIQNRTMVPVRAVFEATGADVTWNDYTKRVTITKGEKTVQVQLDNRTGFIDGKAVIMEVPATGIDGRILVPIRFIGEALGLKVGWANPTQTAYINELSETNTIGNDQNWGKFASDGEWNYHILQNNILIRENIATKKQEKIAEHILNDLQIYKDWIYCIGIDQGNPKVMRFTKDGTEKEVIVKESVTSIQLVNDWVYYGDSQSQTILYRTRTDGTNTKKILQDGNFSPKNWLVQDGWIYYQNQRLGSISRVRVDGSEPTVLTNMYVIPTFAADSLLLQNPGMTYNLKLIDRKYLYLVLEKKGDDGTLERQPGVFRLPIEGGKPQIIMDKLPLSMNMDDEWLYMAVQNQGNNQLIKYKKDGTKELTINEYKRNDTPGSIYVNNSLLYYTLLRGNNKQELFRMNSNGENITQINWVYGANYQQLKDILSNSATAHTTVSSFNMLQVSELKTDKETKKMTLDRRINRPETLYYQKMIAEKEKINLETWMDSKYAYTKKPEDKHWNIHELTAEDAVKQAVFSYISPNEELCNGLTFRAVNDKYILQGTGSFPNLMNSLAASGELVYNNSSDFFDSAIINIVIDRESNLIEELTLEVKYYPQPLDNKNISTSRYSFAYNSFNKTFLYVPISLSQSLNAKKQADFKTVQAQNLIKDGKYQQAIQLLDSAIELYDKSHLAYFHKGNAQYHLGSFKAAISTYEQYRKLMPADLEVLWLEGLCYLKLGNINKAEEMAGLVLDSDQNNTTALNLMGSIAAAKEEYNTASDFYEKALFLDKEYYEPHLNFVTVLYNMGSYTKCIQKVDEFLTRFPTDREMTYLKAQSLSRQGKSEEAIRVYEQILSRNYANDFVTMTYIAIEYEKLQNYTKSQQYANRAQAVYADYNLLKSLLERLIYDRTTSSSQKLVDYIRENYLFFRENDDITKVLNDITLLLNDYTVKDVENLVNIIRDVQDNSTFVLSGERFDAYMSSQYNTDMETKQDENNVYLGIKTFSQEMGIRFTEFVQSIENSEQKTLIIDLRDNFGGLSIEANIMLDALLPACTPSYIIERDGFISSFKSGKSYTRFKKIGILVNERTASSSELLALGLKTYSDNVTIIGRKTMGRGVGQTVYLDRSKKYAIFLVNHYWNVLQENINEEGLPIDIRVGSDDSDYTDAIAKFLNDK